MVHYCAASSIVRHRMSSESRERYSTMRRTARRAVHRTTVLLYLSNTKSRTEYIIGRVYGLCMRRLKSRRSSSRRRKERGRTDGRAGNYIDCVAGWQRQWHMSPKLLVIADLNMRQRDPCRVARCAAPAAPYFCLCLRPLLLLLPSVHFLFFLSATSFFPVDLLTGILSEAG